VTPTTSGEAPVPMYPCKSFGMIDCSMSSKDKWNSSNASNISAKIIRRRAYPKKRVPNGSNVNNDGDEQCDKHTGTSKANDRPEGFGLQQFNEQHGKQVVTSTIQSQLLPLLYGRSRNENHKRTRHFVTSRLSTHTVQK